MAQVKIYFDRSGQSLRVWFGDEETQHSARETGEGVVLLLDQSGEVIGFEKLNFSMSPQEQINVAYQYTD